MGLDGDGAAALCGIKDVGGVTLAQKPETAVQPGMPETAIDSARVNFVLSPEVIALKTAEIAPMPPGKLKHALDHSLDRRDHPQVSCDADRDGTIIASSFTKDEDLRR